LQERKSYLPLNVLNSNVLDTPADALLIPIDGQARGLRGNIAHAFMRRWPDAYEDFESHLEFPVPLGSVRRVDEDTDSPWKTIVFLSTLHHLDTLATDEKLNVIRLALGHAFSKAVSGGLGSYSTAVLKGGWRLPLDLAFRTMIDTYNASQFARQRRTLNVCNLSTAAYERLIAVKTTFSSPAAE
jgi:hypothetical protein